MTEPDPRRNIGPYEDADAAMKQFAATSYAIEEIFSNEQLCGIVIREGLLGSGTDLSPFEQDYLKAYLKEYYDPIFAQLIQGWIIRAHIAGVDKGSNKV